jgi:hypothetical protein
MTNEEKLNPNNGVRKPEESNLEIYPGTMEYEAQKSPSLGPWELR